MVADVTWNLFPTTLKLMVHIKVAQCTIVDTENSRQCWWDRGAHLGTICLFNNLWNALESAEQETWATSRGAGTKAGDGIGVFHPIPISGGLGPECYPGENKELWESIFQLGKHFWGVVKHRCLGTKGWAAPEQSTNTQEMAGEVVGPSCSIRRGSFAACRNPFITITVQFWLTGLLACCVASAWRFISSARFSCFSVSIHHVPWHFTHRCWETSPRKGDPVTQPRAALGLLLPLVKAGRERIVIHNCIHKPFLLKPQNNYRYDHSLSDSFLGTPVFWQVLSQECVLTGTA